MESEIGTAAPNFLCHIFTFQLYAKVSLALATFERQIHISRERYQYYRDHFQAEAMYVLEYAAYRHLGFYQAMDTLTVNLSETAERYYHSIDAFWVVLAALDDDKSVYTSLPTRLYSTTELRKSCERMREYTRRTLRKTIDCFIRREPCTTLRISYALIYNLTSIPLDCWGDYFVRVSALNDSISQHTKEAYDKYLAELSSYLNEDNTRSGELHQAQADIRHYLEAYMLGKLTKDDLAATLSDGMLNKAQFLGTTAITDVLDGNIKAVLDFLQNLKRTIFTGYMAFAAAFVELPDFYIYNKFGGVINGLTIWRRPLIEISGNVYQVLLHLVFELELLELFSRTNSMQYAYLCGRSGAFKRHLPNYRDLLSTLLKLEQ